MEIGSQSLFAEAAFQNISKKGEGNVILTFSSIHSFLSHCANISKILWSNGEGGIRETVGENIASLLGIEESSPIKDMSFRNDFEHYDERLVRWVRNALQKKEGYSIVDYTMNPIVRDNTLYLRTYDPDKKIYTSINRNLDLGILYQELLRVRALAAQYNPFSS